ncbi:MAG TPA: glycosyltransferase family 39 protein [Ignavibacteria bacterium]|mgnify:CR=1 FL=1|nr:glycosyltransferase family 39 protein [Ignavibacteria bacterium]
MPDFYRDKKLRNLLIIFLSSLPVIIHLYTNFFAGYGYFRDELYYIACSNRLDTGYVDQPPFSILILYINRILFGDSLFALRFIPAVTSGLTVFISCLMTREFGGKTFSMILCSIAVTLAPVYLGMNAFYSMNCFDILFWTLAFYLIMKIISESKQSYWIYLGIVFGLGLMNKIGILWLGFGFLTALLLSDKRRELLTIKPYLCALIALTIFTPYILWNWQNDFAHIEFIKNATSGKYSGLNIIDFISGQFLNVNPISAFIWIPGLYYLLFNHQGIKYRILAIIYITVFIILILNGHSKAEYLAPAYVMLFASGSTFIDKKTVVRSRWIRYVIMYPLIITGILFAPLAIPVLSVETYIVYAKQLGRTPSSSENKELSELPQFYADMHGWEEMAKNVSEVYLSLPREERLRTIVFGRNYGEAAAMEFYRNLYPIPRVISSHNNYWLWGYPQIEDPVIIIIGGNKEDHEKLFETVDEKLTHISKYSMPYENNLPIFIAGKMKVPISEEWSKIKNYD